MCQDSFLFINFWMIFACKNKLCHRITESLNGWGWIGPQIKARRSSGPTTLLKQGHLEQVAKDGVQMTFEYLQGQMVHNLSGQPIPLLIYPHSEEVFPNVKMGPPVFQCVPTTSCPVTGHHWKGSGYIFCTPSDIYVHWRDPPSLLFPTPNGPLFLSCSTYERCSSPLTVLVALQWSLSNMSISFLNWEAQNWTQYSKCGLTRAE